MLERKGRREMERAASVHGNGAADREPGCGAQAPEQTAMLANFGHESRARKVVLGKVLISSMRPATQ
jgi:hypothetical protein